MAFLEAWASKTVFPGQGDVRGVGAWAQFMAEIAAYKQAGHHQLRQRTTCGIPQEYFRPTLGCYSDTAHTEQLERIDNKRKLEVEFFTRKCLAEYNPIGLAR